MEAIATRSKDATNGAPGLTRNKNATNGAKERERGRWVSLLLHHSPSAIDGRSARRPERPRTRQTSVPFGSRPAPFGSVYGLRRPGPRSCVSVCPCVRDALGPFVPNPSAVSGGGKTFVAVLALDRGGEVSLVLRRRPRGEGPLASHKHRVGQRPHKPWVNTSEKAETIRSQ